MCMYTIYVHGCGHYATGLFLTNTCMLQCEAAVDLDDLRRDLGWPYQVRYETHVNYIDLETVCIDCFRPTNPYMDIELPDNDPITWHVPYVECNEHLFRPVDFGPGNQTQELNRQVSQPDFAIRQLEDAGSANSSDDLRELEDPGSAGTYSSTSHELSTAITGPGLLSHPPSFEIIHESNNNSFPADNPSVPPFHRFEHQLPSPLDPMQSLTGSKKSRKMSYHISQETNHIIDDYLRYPTSSQMTFSQPIWGAYPDLPSATSPAEHPYLRPIPLYLRHNVDPSQQFEHSTGLMMGTESYDINEDSSSEVLEDLNEPISMADMQMSSLTKNEDTRHDNVEVKEHIDPVNLGKPIRMARRPWEL